MYIILKILCPSGNNIAEKVQTIIPFLQNLVDRAVADCVDLLIPLSSVIWVYPSFPPSRLINYFWGLLFFWFTSLFYEQIYHTTVVHSRLLRFYS